MPLDDRIAVQVGEADLTAPGTLSLLRIHLMGMHAHSPPGAVYALDLSGLSAPGVTVWSAQHENTVVGIGALKRLADGSGEIKSMRTHPDYLRRGVGAAILERIIQEGQRQGLTRLSLETGSGPAFEPALALYRKRGFENGAAFAEYVRSDFNQFLHLQLGVPR